MRAITTKKHKSLKQKKISKITFLTIIISTHILGLLLLIIGITVGIILKRFYILGNPAPNPNPAFFSNETWLIDSVIYIMIFLGVVMLCSMVTYWFVVLKVKIMISYEKKDGIFLKDEWEKYSYLINFDKINSHKIKKVGKNAKV